MHKKDKNRNALKHDGVEPIRLHDDHGRLVAAGVEWVEARKIVLFLVSIVIFVIIVYAGMMGLATLTSGFAFTPLAWFLFFTALFYFIRSPAVYISFRRRSMIFHVDGSLTTPLGGLAYIGGLGPPKTHTDIISIEAKCNGEDYYCIDMYAGEGDKHSVGHRMHDLIAHKATVQLTKALKEIREAMGEDIRRAGGQKHRQLEVID